MSLQAFTPKSKQDTRSILEVLFSLGVTSVPDAIGYLENDIDTDIAERMKDRRRLERIDPEERKLMRERQRVITAEKKEQEAAKKTAPICPSCGKGRMVRSCGGAVTCSNDCGYSAMRRK